MSNYRWVLGWLGQVKGWVALAVLLMTAEILSNTATIWLNQQMIDDVLVAGHRDRFWPVLIQLAAAYALYSILFTLGPHMIHISVAKLRTLQSRQLMRSMFRIPVAELQKERTGHYVYHFTNDLAQSADLIGNDIPRMTQQFAGAVFLIAIMGTASPSLLVMVAAISVLYILIGRKFSAPRKAAGSEVSKNRSQLIVHLEEGVSSTREVLAFRRQAWEERRYRELFRIYYDSVMDEAKLFNRQLAISDPFKWLAVILVLFYGGWLVLENRLSLGLFVVSFQFTSRLMDTLSALFNGWMQLAGRMAAVDRIRSVMDGSQTADGSTRLTGPIRELQLIDVSFGYAEEGCRVLSDVSIALPVGRKIALVGASGGGKSTIASLLARFFDPDGGMIAVNGTPLAAINREDWAGKATAVFQEPYLFPDTIRMNLLFGLEDVSDEKLRDACSAMRIHDFIAVQPAGYETLVGERGITLSGGQRQRLALARALLRDPELLILDEATSSLDMETEREIQRALDERRSGKTTVIIAHRLSTIRNADVIYVLDGGIVAEQGTHEELMQLNGRYCGLVAKMSTEAAGIGA
ncbi:ABC transporter ATP-binding protein [Paenibacillus sacheonensis]|uniref:ATP-binding cassette domain-containing protein n=1 Tax=Paenibacillus sacheonensis TaxID=742054 RepID=A0A7X4YQA0_9BACL|nr:ABC transporter ATP-binding protein [Paenibacillus sacheonensis]MBM7566369.1 ABC-type multidrug transport system fused ATPase/permease subunit [Paenibacillus sacheonensis]NBC70571.1 ATP-binding cassette domain-containing protein [Paenibacillus sacheonensis]